jgi:hypothetical protein
MQIAKGIFHKNLSIMKQILDLGEFKLGKNSEDFKYFKKQIFDFTYKGLQSLFKQLGDENIIKKCPKNCSIRKGYSDCECGGSGYINVKEK